LHDPLAFNKRSDEATRTTQWIRG